jgi:uncharacterized membrane protein
MQAKHPEVVDMITQYLKALYEACAPITLVMVYGIIMATILHMAPEIFKKTAKDSSYFRCSDSFLHQWLHETLHWSEHQATRAAHKLHTD